MSPSEVLTAARDAVRRGNGAYVFSDHVRNDRMPQHDATANDVRRLIETATIAQPQDDGSWRLLGGSDTDDRELVVVIAFFGGGRIKIVTLMDPK